MRSIFSDIGKETAELNGVKKNGSGGGGLAKHATAAYSHSTTPIF
jgi:hypothetical protein